MLKIILLFFTVMVLSVAPVLASGFILQNIGSLDTGGNQYPEWWYQGVNPTLSGSAAPNAAVVVSVDGAAQTVTADASGHWSAATTIPDGDHTISLSSGGSVISFTLHINQTMPADVGAPAAATQPIAGITAPTLMLVIGGLSLAIFGLITKRQALLYK